MSNYDNATDNIVRCKNCIFNPYTTAAKGLDNDICPLLEFGDEYYSEIPADWFCAYGERSEE